ncbi:MAG: NINE protein [Candidatus Heimdallarchaeaceae archaeon]
MAAKFFCPNCGTSLEQGVKFCANCGKQIQEPTQQQPVQQLMQQQQQVVVVQQPMQQQPPSPHSRGVALILCIFLGYLGLHRFYVGNVGMGIVYLFTLGIFGFGPFIDFFSILFGSFRDIQGRDIQGRLLTEW